MDRILLTPQNERRAGVLEDMERRHIVSERIGFEIAHPVGAGDPNDMLHRQVPHAVTLIAIDADEGEFGALRRIKI
jgi:hypothetical protein